MTNGERSDEQQEHIRVGRLLDKAVTDLERYKKALWTANGLLIGLNCEPVKLEYPATQEAKS